VIKGASSEVLEAALKSSGGDVDFRYQVSKELYSRQKADRADARLRDAAAEDDRDRERARAREREKREVESEEIASREAAYEKSIGAPDLAHLAKENKIAADVGGVMGGADDRARLESRQRATDPEGLSAAERTAKTERHIARQRANEGAGGTRTPEEGDKVRVTGKVFGAGKKATVVGSSPSGTHKIVRFSDGSEASYSNSDLESASAKPRRAAKPPGGDWGIPGLPRRSERGTSNRAVRRAGNEASSAWAAMRARRKQQG
jgi:hypothetical protein